MAQVDTNAATLAAANTIAWKLRGFEVEREEVYKRGIDSDPTHRVGVWINGDCYVSVDVISVHSDAQGQRHGMALRLRHFGVDVDVSITHSPNGSWYPWLGRIDPRSAGIDAVLIALEAIRPILKTLAR